VTGFLGLIVLLSILDVAADSGVRAKTPRCAAATNSNSILERSQKNSSARAPAPSEDSAHYERGYDKPVLTRGLSAALAPARPQANHIQSANAVIPSGNGISAGLADRRAALHQRQVPTPQIDGPDNYRK